MNNSFVKSTAFSYEKLKEKARREIDRLKEAEYKAQYDDLEKEHILDHALNAAFSVYHLLEWREKTQNPESKKKANALCASTNNQGLKMLHSIVTCNKHVTVSSPFDNISPFNIEGISYTLTTHVITKEGGEHVITKEGGEHVITKEGKPLILSERVFTVKFGDRKAIEILNEAMTEFENC